MRARPWSLVAVALVAAAAISGLPATGMRGAGSPDWDVGHPRSLTEFTACPPGLPCSPAPAVFYPAASGPDFVAPCASSPLCIPTVDPHQASPWFGTPPPSGRPIADAFDIPNPCKPAPATPLFVGSPNTYTDPDNHPAPARYAEWSPIESLTNLRAPAGLEHLLPGSIANTPFNGPPGTPLHNRFATPPGATGDGRFHLDNHSVVQSVFDTARQANTLFVANGDPTAVEGAPDSRFALLGHDGYVLGRFAAPVEDGDGYDLAVNVAMPPSTAYGTFCVYGATSPTGPFTLVHSAFRHSSNCDRSLRTSASCPEMPAGAPACPAAEYCFGFDLAFYYTPLRTLQGAADPGRLDWVLVVNSLDHTPYLRNGFEVRPPTAAQPLRGLPYAFNDTTVRFGYPLWWDLREPEVPHDPPTEGAEFQPDPSDTRPDPVAMWRWDFRGDPYSVEPSGMPSAPPFPPHPPGDPLRSMWEWKVQPSDHNATHTFVAPGVFPICLSVHTYDQGWASPGLLSRNMTVLRQSDPPAADRWPTRGWGSMPPGPPPMPEPVWLNREPLPYEMHCQPVTVENVPPVPAADPAGGMQDPRLITFHDRSRDDDWIMPPGHAYGPPQLVGGFTGFYVHHYDGCCACPDCPPDGIQLRAWDFDSDGVTDHLWEYRARNATDGRFCRTSVVQPMVPPLMCPTDPSGFPGAGHAAEPRYLHSRSIMFTAADVGATVYGAGIRPGTRIDAVIAPDLAMLNIGVAADVTFADYGAPFVVSWPYDAGADAPQHLYPHPGEFNATLRVCDHDWTIRTAEPLFGSRAWPAPFQLQRSYLGDPQPPFTDMAGNPLPDSPMPFHGHSLHACQTSRVPVRIPNMPPRLTVPPTLAVAPHQQVTFTVRGTDTDPGQTLTLRPCPGVPLLPGMAFAPVAVPGQSVSQVVSFNVGDLPVGRYGPFCFEVGDGWATVHANMMIWVSGTKQDTDGDGVVDLADNCPGVPNHDQADGDRDGVGDACQADAASYEVPTPRFPGPAETTDHDGDGFDDAVDTCPSMADRLQGDLDGDGVGDLCDRDADGDGVVTDMDLCPLRPDPRQEDADRDGRGDACDAEVADGADGTVKARTVTPVAEPAAWPRLALGASLGLLALLAVAVPTIVVAVRRGLDERRR